MKWIGGAAAVAVVGLVVAALALRSEADGRRSDAAIGAVSPETGSIRRATARRLSRVVGGVRFSFALPRCCWEAGPRRHLRNLEAGRGRILVGESSWGSQGAEAVFFWAAFPEGGRAEPCANLLRRPVGPSASHLVSAMTRTPGIEVADGPVKVTLGGRPAIHVALRAFLDLGCDPGFFFTWQPRGRTGECWGACWLESSKGDEIGVWVVEGGGRRLVFEAITGVQAEPAAAQEIRQMVESIRFHS